ncbi:hypothetical protein GLOTRDRAFT_111181 [Gloeophyllum trabeum ATCC 11539]|uniref:C2H2-type domain-containing protein n=1 Tax=Gloeophyllum trabeum (strain ATCC 11539 / FP-39264 / Madison 617) TaxID=670483 RepID=S7Q6V1_GLOTA|nr:uncharacterized protein GLOTRDRAFT_111181 [Gloeophyllum trabeum ATCC 11539]EPQ55252.1 hypothetical protein GLOTRDRAFT_111181 [Gloeophyllum trabeum ATCC 11539]
MTQSPTLQSSSFACRWDWCRATFATHTSLVDHVVDSHIKTARPVKRKEVPLIRRAEEGDGTATDSLLASSGPAKSPSVRNATTPARSFESPAVTFRTPSPSRAYHSPALTPPPSTPPRSSQAQRSPRPSFNYYGAQSSPAETASTPSVSESPALANLVANAINDLSEDSLSSRIHGSPVPKAAKRPRTDDPEVHAPGSPRVDQPHAGPSPEAMDVDTLDSSTVAADLWSSAREAQSTEGSASQSAAYTTTGVLSIAPSQNVRSDALSISVVSSTTSSQDVESQLTQDLEIQQTSLQPEARPADAVLQTLSGVSQTLQSSQSTTFSPTPPRPQAWYQTHPYLSFSQASQPHGNSTPPSAQNAHKTPSGRVHVHAHSHPHHPSPFFPFRSHTVRISPGPAPSTDANGRQKGSSPRPGSASGERPVIHVHHVHHNHRHDHPHPQVHLQASGSESGASTPSQSTAASSALEKEKNRSPGAETRFDHAAGSDSDSQASLGGGDTQASLPLHFQLQTQAQYQSQPESQNSARDV